jgi:hypothetical protein
MRLAMQQLVNFQSFNNNHSHPMKGSLEGSFIKGIFRGGDGKDVN